MNFKKSIRFNWFTDWQDEHTKPVLAGVYQRNYSDKIGYCYFGNGIWYISANSVEEAKSYYIFGYSSGNQSLTWRGIKEKSSAL